MKAKGDLYSEKEFLKDLCTELGVSAIKFPIDSHQSRNSNQRRCCRNMSIIYKNHFMTYYAEKVKQITTVTGENEATNTKASQAKMKAKKAAANEANYESESDNVEVNPPSYIFGFIRPPPPYLCTF